MPQDAYTLRYLCQELNDIFKGGKVNRIVQLAPEEVVFTVYTGKNTRKLYISVNPSRPRIGVTETERESPLTAPNFCMLLRKHLLSATINEISLLDFDRIVKIDFTASSEFFDAGEKTLFVELMGRYSNIILTENGKVAGGNRGVNFFDNGVRPLIVGRDYVLPPAGDKKSPKDENLVSYFNSGDGALYDKILSGVSGVAADTAKEIERKYFEEFDEFSAEKFCGFLKAFIYEGEKRPCVAMINGEAKDVFVYPYGGISGEIKAFDTLCAAEDYYFTERERVKSFKDKKERVTAVVNSAIKKAKKKLSAINARINDAKDCESDKIKGELILSNIYKIKRGDKSVTVVNYYDGQETTIPLDETMTPSQNAERFYKRYNKAKRTLIAQQPQKQAAENELNYLNTVLDEISLAENVADVTLIKEELQNAGLIRAEKQNARARKAAPKKYRVYEVDGFTVKVGRNNVENDELTFSAKSNDIWLHAKDYHSSHVIIECAGKTVTDRALITAAEICAYYGKGRDGGKTEIAYTLKKYVKKPPKSALGFCTYTDFKSVTVNPLPREEFLKSK